MSATPTEMMRLRMACLPLSCWLSRGPHVRSLIKLYSTRGIGIANEQSLQKIHELIEAVGFRTLCRFGPGEQPRRSDTCCYRIETSIAAPTGKRSANSPYGPPERNRPTVPPICRNSNFLPNSTFHERFVMIMLNGYRQGDRALGSEPWRSRAVARQPAPSGKDGDVVSLRILLRCWFR